MINYLWIFKSCMINYNIIYINFIKYMFCILWCCDIIIFDNWDIYRLFYLFNNILICFFFIYLYLCMFVNCYSLVISMFNSFSIFYCENMFFILIDMYFNCNWFFYSIYNCCYYFIYFIWI